MIINDVHERHVSRTLFHGQLKLVLNEQCMIELLQGCHKAAAVLDTAEGNQRKLFPRIIHWTTGTAVQRHIAMYIKSKAETLLHGR